MAASWGFMLPSGTGPNALAWATGHIALPPILKAGLALDIPGVPLLIDVIWSIALLGCSAHSSFTRNMARYKGGNPHRASNGHARQTQEKHQDYRRQGTPPPHHNHRPH